MSQGDDDQEKSHEPTQKRLDDARKKGEIPRFTDLTTAAAYAGFTMTAGLFAVAAFGAVHNLGARTFSRAPELADAFFDGPSRGISATYLIEGAQAGLIWIVGPVLCVLAVLLGTRSIAFVPDKLAPKMSRISPLSNAGQKFGRGGLFEFGKSALKLMLYGTLLTWFVWRKLPVILPLMQLPPQIALSISMRMVFEFCAVVVGVALCLGVVDALWQYAEHRRKNMMSQQEIKEEFKQAEGDPAVKQQRRQKGMAIARNQMLADVPGADVIIVNPTHYAVALKWDPNGFGAPVCVAKGVDAIAARIREIAVESGVPIHRDPPTARALFAAVDIGQEVPRDHYRAVAAAIRFAQKIRARAQT